MPRANRHFLSGYIWHITQRCHRKAFLLKFAKDRARWIRWLYQAKRRYGLCVLNYTVTCNHVHLLVRDLGCGEIPPSMQLVAGRTAQEFNKRKSRRGAFWEDRYHATAVESDEHLVHCLAYIDLNMIRAGVVVRPEDWAHGGFREIQNPPSRFRIIDTAMLMNLLNVSDPEKLAKKCKETVESTLHNGMEREACWTESLAVGSMAFIEEVKGKMGANARGRHITKSHTVTTLSEAPGVYFDRENTPLRLYLGAI